jgi:ubiquinone/menaquinone biosynthesis C-methylase UbiE
VNRVVGVDINAAYLEIVSSRYSGRFQNLELCSADISQAHLEIAPVDLVYAALVFEYIDVPSALRNLFFACLRKWRTTRGLRCETSRGQH